jgi:hypothetical protein
MRLSASTLDLMYSPGNDKVVACVHNRFYRAADATIRKNAVPS